MGARELRRYAGFVDGGFLKKAGAKALKHESTKLNLDPAALVAWLKSLQPFGREDEFLRTYWYEGEFDSGDSRHPAQKKYFDFLDATPGLEVRTGYLIQRTPDWHYPLKQALKHFGVDLAEFQKRFEMKPELIQKGVDALITLDLVHHADNGSYDWALLLAGDRDLVEAVWNVQDEGKHVVVAIPKGAGLAPELRRRADALVELDEELLSRILIERKPKKGADATPAPVPPEAIEKRG